MVVKSKLKRRAKRMVALLGFALVVQVFVIPQIGGARMALSVVGSLSPLLLGLAIILYGLALLVYARMTQMLLPVEVRPGLPIVFGTVLASTGVNHVVPGGGATTGAVNYHLLGRAGVPRSDLGFALASQAIGSAVVLNLILWLALVISIPAGGFQPIYATAAGVGAVLIAVFSAVVIAMLRGRDRLASRACAIAGRIPKVDGERVRAAIVKIADQLALLAADRSRLRMVLVFAALNWLFDAAALWVTLSAFGHRPGIAGLLVAHGLANMIPTLIAFGTPAAVASVGVVVYRLVSFWLPIPIGALSYVAVEGATHKSAHRRGFRGELNAQLDPET